MKRKVEITVKKKVHELGKRRANEKGRQMNSLIRGALVSHLKENEPSLQNREKAYQFFCEQPIKITRKQLQEIMEEDW